MPPGNMPPGGGPAGGPMGGPGMMGPGMGGPMGGPGMGGPMGGPGMMRPGMGGPGMMRPGMGPMRPMGPGHSYQGNTYAGTSNVGIFNEIDAVKVRTAIADVTYTNPIKHVGYSLFGGVLESVFALRFIAKQTKIENDHKAKLISDEEYEYRMNRLKNPDAEKKENTKETRKKQSSRDDGVDGFGYYYHKHREKLYKKKLAEVNKRYMNYEITEEEARQIMKAYEAELNAPSKGHSR